MNYWLEALEASLDENRCYESLTGDQRIAVAKDLERAAEMHGEATGAHYIPNPLSTELKKLQRALEEEKTKTDRAHSDFIKNVAKRWGVMESQVELEGNGEATVYI